MNPMLQMALGALIRAGLATAAGYIVRGGIWTQGAAETYVSAATIFLLSYGWSIWQKHKDRATLLVSLSSRTPMTELEAKEVVKQGLAPSVSTPKDVIPVAPTIPETEEFP